MVSMINETANMKPQIHTAMAGPGTSSIIFTSPAMIGGDSTIVRSVDLIKSPTKVDIVVLLKPWRASMTKVP